MDAVNCTDFKENVENYLNKAYDNHEPLIITRDEGKNVVLLSSADYYALTETLYLLSNKANNEYLFNSIEQVGKGRKIEKSIEDLKKCE